MLRLPRLALATTSQGPEPAPASLALLAALTSKRWRIQHFRCQARPFPSDSVGRVTGLPGRHLDAWLMTEPVCRDVFARGARHADLAVVEGTLDDQDHGLGPYPFVRPGRLKPVAAALDAPLVAVLDCREVANFHLPHLDRDIDAVLLDGLPHAEDFDRLRQVVTQIWRRPVLGALEALPEDREALQRDRDEGPLPEGPIQRLGQSFLRFADLGAIRVLAEGRPLPAEPELASLGGGRRFRVAYAQDEAFGGYFPDTLETLEALGAELLEFSPLRDETLPRGVDLVMIGCGFPDRHADALAANLSLIAALRQHVCRGHRIYSEGGGTAYLGQAMVLDGRKVPGAGILPFEATLEPGCRVPEPVSRRLTRDCWLGRAGTTVRGYRSMRWGLRPILGPRESPTPSGLLTPQGDMYFRHHAVGGLIHLHLASLPQVVSAFAGLHRPSLTLPRIYS
jgi:cobyrinic acid a,c-diamide synthase